MPLGRQALGVVVVLTYALVVSGVLATVVHRVLGFRVHEDHEVSGVDLVLHAETAYDFHAAAGTRHSIFASHATLSALSKESS